MEPNELPPWLTEPPAPTVSALDQIDTLPSYAEARLVFYLSQIEAATRLFARVLARDPTVPSERLGDALRSVRSSAAHAQDILNFSMEETHGSGEQNDSRRSRLVDTTGSLRGAAGHLPRPRAPRGRGA